MLELVTKVDARAQLRLDSSGGIGPDDAWLALSIPAVSGAVAGWLKDSWRLYEPEIDSAGEVVPDSDGNPVPAEDSNGDPIVHPTVRLAVLVELDRQYRFRDGSGDGDVTPDAGHGYTLGRGATALLTPFRRPTVS
jgi:hypothetical protein